MSSRTRHPTLSSAGSSSNYDRRGWVSNVRKNLEEELEDLSEIPVSIFNVPKALITCDPELYTPQQVSIGPYHYWRQDVYEMERYKIAAAKRAQRHLKNLKFDKLVEQLIGFESKVRACYHKYLDIDSETLAWMMAIDSSFLLEYLVVYATQEGKELRRVSSRMTHLVDFAGRKSAHNAIVRDMVMLENQIPLFVLRMVLEFQLLSLELADEMLSSMLLGMCKEFLPFKMTEDLPAVQVSARAHLLDVLYHMIVPESGDEEVLDEVVVEVADEKKDHGTCSKCCFSLQGNVGDCFGQIWSLLSKMNKGPVIKVLKKIILAKPLKLLVKLPWTVISKLPGFAALKTPIELLFSGGSRKEDQDSDSSSTSNKSKDKPPTIEEITIPSVTELASSGVTFAPTTGSISSISFDTKTAILYLPIVTLDLNTEVILRNLVAYEASHASGPLVFTRYTELMNGIVDGEEDAQVLRDKGIVFNHLKTDREVADIWNGMSKSLRLTKVPFIDKVIEDVNKYHNGRWKVKTKRFMKRYIFGSWQFLTFLAAVIMLLLTTLQAFCSVYSCARLFHLPTT
ncbi:unnamed protein product [Rhodiola kirilowii]